MAKTATRMQILAARFRALVGPRCVHLRMQPLDRQLLLAFAENLGPAVGVAEALVERPAVAESASVVAHGQHAAPVGAVVCEGRWVVVVDDGKWHVAAVGEDSQERDGSSAGKPEDTSEPCETR